MDISHEQSRTYTWILADKNTPSLKIVQPLSLDFDHDGGHIVHGSDNCIYTIKEWQILKVEFKGGGGSEQEKKIITG